ncbi:MAG: aminoacyl-tRNA hydrolase [Candidatus Diapherotrites archaeon]|nr:aminoacyl-tRNA hydrolase [Candidatus Diapherotrites archaeon]
MGSVQYIIVNKGINMKNGKTCAQVAHASLEVLDKVDPEIIKAWRLQGMKKVVLKVKGDMELLELFERAKKELPCALITDAGHTQVAAGSKTCFACGPVEEAKGAKYFKHLKLL